MQSQPGRPLGANQDDFRDSINEVLLNGLLSGAPADRQPLLTDQSLQLSVPLVRQALLQVIQYNLAAIEQIALTPNQCTLGPLQQSRVAIEKARDAALGCLISLRNSPSDTTTFQSCLQTVYPTAQQDIDALRPSINACLQSNASPSTGSDPNSAPAQNVQNTNAVSQ